MDHITPVMSNILEQPPSAEFHRSKPEAREIDRTQLHTRDWYRTYYQRKGKTRNDLLRNRGVLFQKLAFDASVVQSLRNADLDPSGAKILDVGCGNGDSLLRFLHMGFAADNLHGIDILEERTESAMRRFPNMRFTSGDASEMPYLDDEFDLVMESTMFVQLTDPDLSRRIAAEMLRVAKTGAYVMLVDWRYSKPGNSGYLGLSKQRIEKLFGVGRTCRTVCQSRGALLPPFGRALSKYAPALYFLAGAVMPPLVGQVCTLLQKTSR